MAKSAKYWQERFRQLEESQHKSALSCYEDIEQQYRQAQRTLEGQIAAWYQRFADNNGMSLAEAKKTLNSKELQEFKWDVKQYIKYGQENAVTGEWMKELENASARYHISRLDSLKIQTQQTLEQMFGNQLDSIDSTMRSAYTSGYYHTAYEIQKGAGVGWDFATLDERKIEKVIHTPWAVDGKNFSERIWGNKQKLINELNQTLTQNIIIGQDPQKAIDALAKRMNVSKANAGRLVMTEEAYFSSEAQKDCFKELDVEQYEIVATLDSRTSEICQEMDGKTFRMSEWEVGVNAPPFHVNCRTTTIPYFDDEFSDTGKRAARGEDGKTYYVPADTTYKEWEKAYVNGDKSGLQEVKTDDTINEKTPEPDISNSLAKDTEETKIEPKYKFVEVTTIEEAQDYAQQFCNDGFMAKTFKGKIDYRGISVDNANAINKALTETFNSVEMEKISGIKVISPSSSLGKKAFPGGTDAVFSYSPVEHGIFVNKEVAKDVKTFEEYVKRSEDATKLVMDNIDKLSGSSKELALTYQKAGRSLVDGKTIEGMFKHELGHHTQWTLLDTETNNAVGRNMSQYAPKISGYANASKSEYLAESFSAYIKGERDLLDPQYVSFMDKKAVAKASDDGIIKANKVINGHDGTPRKYEAGGIIDHVGKDGKVETRTFYNTDGMKSLDITNHDHGNPKKHPYGKHGEHAHDYEWDSDGKLKNRTTRDITDAERKENGDIL